jgi:hypothetical protein
MSNSHPQLQQPARPSLEGELEKLLGETKERLGADIVCHFVYDAHAQSFHTPTGIGLLDPDSFRDPKMRPRIDRGVPKRVFAKSPLTLENIEADQELNGAFAHREHVRALAGVSCRHDERILGMLFASFRKAHPFPESEIQALQAFADKAAGIVAQFSILQYAPRPAEVWIKPEDKTLQGIVELACSLTKAPVGIWLLDEEDKTRLRIRASTGFPVEYRDSAACSLGDSSLIVAAIAGDSWQVAQDLQNDPHFAYRDIAYRAGWVAAFVYPIVSRSRPGQSHQASGCISSSFCL